MVAGVALSSALALADHGVAVVGEIPAGLPSLELPRTPLDDVFQLLPAAVGLFLVTFADGILTARSYAGRHGRGGAARLGAANARPVSQGCRRSG